jgi:hypothetical protein
MRSSVLRTVYAIVLYDYYSTTESNNVSQALMYVLCTLLSHITIYVYILLYNSIQNDEGGDEIAVVLTDMSAKEIKVRVTMHAHNITYTALHDITTFTHDQFFKYGICEQHSIAANATRCMHTVTMHEQHTPCTCYCYTLLKYHDVVTYKSCYFSCLHAL